MKNKLKILTMLSVLFTGVTMAQESEMETGINHQTLDGLNKPIDTKAPDYIANKGFGTGTYYIWVSASGSAPTSSTLDYSYAGGGCMRQDGNPSANGDFDVNLQLPDGHQIQGYRFYWYDASASSSRASLFQFDGAGGTTLLGNNDSTGESGFGESYLNLFTDNIIVNNFNGSYTIRFNSNESSDDQRVCAVRLFMDSDPS